MDDIARVCVETITESETTLVNSTNGVVAKSVLISNAGKKDKKAKLNIDGKDFIFPVGAESTLRLDSVLVFNILKGSTLPIEENTNTATKSGEDTDTSTGAETPTTEPSTDEANELNIFISGLKLGVA